MLAVIQITSGPAAGTKTVLSAGQKLRVGRCAPADLVVSGDDSLAEVHFVIQADDDGCALAEIPGSRGTFVNGQAVAEATKIRHGDAIYAGRTLFKVHLQVEPQGKPAAVVNSPAVAKTASRVTFTTEKCDSSLNLCRGTVGEILPADLADRLAGRHALYLVVDFNKLGRPCPEDLGEPQYLFDWLDPVVLPLASPMIIPAKALPDWRDLLTEAWGNDAVVCLFSKTQPHELLEHLRKRSRAKSESGGMAGAVLGWCWPSVLAPLLAHHAAGAVKALVEGIEAVLVELPDLPETWQLYGCNGVATLLSDLGFEDKTTAG